MSPLLQLLAGCLAAATGMTGLWFLQRRTGNAGVVDVGWAAAIALLAVAYALTGQGTPSHRWAAGAMGAIWGFRLAFHIHRRSHGKPEDGRYQQLRREWGERVQSRMFRFYQLQAIAAAFFALPFLIASASPRPGFGWLEWVGVTLWLAGILGEAVADAQLETFKRNAENRGQVCNRGLWRASRHPNYFFEWVTWCGIAVFALPSPWGALALLCPAAMLFLLLRLTGIPATEAQALRSKGEAYRRYQQTTSRFVPWFPRKTIP